MVYRSFGFYSASSLLPVFLFDVITQSKHALTLRHLRQLWLFVIIGIYFVFCWTRSGQTLAMQTRASVSQIPTVKDFR
jgi:hypothetical protein